MFASHGSTMISPVSPTVFTAPTIRNVATWLRVYICTIVKEKKIVFIWFFGVNHRVRNASGGFFILDRSQPVVSKRHPGFPMPDAFVFTGLFLPADDFPCFNDIKQAPNDQFHPSLFQARIFVS